MSTGLGRGLGSLIPNKEQQEETKRVSAVKAAVVADGFDAGRILQISPSDIKKNPMQPRIDFAEASIRELAESISEHGIIQPLVVTKSGSGYELIAGERRLRAAESIGMQKVPVIVRDANQQKKLELALIENLQREDLNPIETAMSYERLIHEFGMGHEDVAAKVGKSRPQVSNTLRLLNLPEEVKSGLLAGKISTGHARYILGLDSEVKQMNIYRKIIHNNLTVEETGRDIRRSGGTKDARIQHNYQDQDKELRLSQFFGTKTQIKRKSKGGQIIITYFGDDDLNSIMDKLGE